MINNDNHITLSAFHITLIYVVVAGLWIAFTDQFLDYMASDTEYLSTLQTYKGWFYVLITGLGLYWLIKKHDHQLFSKEQKLTKVLEELRSEKELKDSLIERIPVMITIYDPELNEFQLNKEFEKVLGWSNEEVKEKILICWKCAIPMLNSTRKYLILWKRRALDGKNSP